MLGKPVARWAPVELCRFYFAFRVSVRGLLWCACVGCAHTATELHLQALAQWFLKSGQGRGMTSQVRAKPNKRSSIPETHRVGGEN